MKKNLKVALNSHLRRTSILIWITLILVFISILLIKINDLKKQAERLEMSVVNTISKPLMENDLIAFKNITRALNDSNKQFNICLRYKENLIFGEKCKGSRYQKYSLALSNEVVFVSTEILFWNKDLYLFIFIFVIIGFGLSLLDKAVKKQNKYILSDLLNLDKEGYSDFLYTEFFNIKQSQKNAESVKIENEMLKLKSEISLQVAHDIRSPLTALEVAMEDLKNLPEDSRNLTIHAINRIQDIANNLSKQEMVESKGDICVPEVVLGQIVNEKRIEYQAKEALVIKFENELGDVEFARIRGDILSRIISNVVNNSVEAMSSSGLISIKLYSGANGPVISVADNGAGFPDTFLNKGISKGHSVGKESGQGLGLHYSKTEIEKIGGEFKLMNDNGAKILIELPLESAPAWFINQLRLNNSKKVLIVDDDQSIHDIWKKKLKDTNLELSHAFKANEITDEEFDLVLIDYDLRESQTGIDIIKSKKFKRAILVTSNYENDSVCEFCEAESIKMIPKQIVRRIKVI